MLNLFKRTRRLAQAPGGADPLKIRNLLDDPRLQAVMSTAALADMPVGLPRPGAIRSELDLGTAA